MTTLEYTLNNESPAFFDIETFAIDIPKKCGRKFGDFRRHEEEGRSKK